MRFHFAICILFLSFAAQAAPRPFVQAMKLEISGRGVPEGTLLVEQMYKGQSAYTLSYYVGAQTVRTQVLLKKSFDTYANLMKGAAPAVENWNGPSLLRCESMGAFGSETKTQKKVKKICFDALSGPAKSKFTNAYAKLKDVAFGHGF